MPLLTRLRYGTEVWPYLMVAVCAAGPVGGTASNATLERCADRPDRRGSRSSRGGPRDSLRAMRSPMQNVDESARSDRASATRSIVVSQRGQGRAAWALGAVCAISLLGGAGCKDATAPGNAAAPANQPTPVRAEAKPMLAAPPPAAPTTCTLETPLVPGVPGSPGHLIATAQNPNGQSELAALMRTMQGELKAAREVIVSGGQGPIGPFLPRFLKIRCAWPTNPPDRDAKFDGFAQAYLAAVAGLDQAGPPERAAAFDRVLGACRTCHENSCTGAIVAIDALLITPRSKPAAPAKK